MHLNYAVKVDSTTCFRQQLFYLTELNSTSEIKPSLSVATVVVHYSKLLQPFLSRHKTLLLLCWGRVLRDETKHGYEGDQLSTEVTRRFNRYFINNNNNNKNNNNKKKKKKKINIITIINISIDNNNNNNDNNNNNSNEDLNQLLNTEPQYRF